MTLDVDDAVDGVSRAIGLDAYVMFPDSKRMIPDAVLWGFASACILKFAEGFVDFKSLGEAARAQLDGLLQAWKAKRDFEHKVDVAALEPVVGKVLQALPATLPAPEVEGAVQRLADALVELGVKPGDAQRHAARVAELLASKE